MVFSARMGVAEVARTYFEARTALRNLPTDERIFEA